MNEIIDSFETLGSIVLTPLAIVGVGYWVNTVIRKKSQSDSIVVSNLQDLQKEINGLILNSINTPDVETRTVYLRRLSNEILHFVELHALLVGEKDKEKLESDLRQFVFDLKVMLSKSSPTNEELAKARNFGNRLRTSILKYSLNICDKQNYTIKL